MSGYLERLVRRAVGPAARGRGEEARSDDALHPRPRSRFETEPGGGEEPEVMDEVAVRPPSPRPGEAAEDRMPGEPGNDRPRRRARPAPESAGPRRAEAPPAAAEPAAVAEVPAPRSPEPPADRQAEPAPAARRSVATLLREPPVRPVPIAAPPAGPAPPGAPSAPVARALPEPAAPESTPPAPALPEPLPAPRAPVEMPVVTVREARRPADRPVVDRRAVELTARALVARHFATAEGDPAGDRGPLRLTGDGEPRIEVHVNRVEVVRRADPAPEPVPARRPRPAPRGFADLASLRGHARRGWS